MTPTDPETRTVEITRELSFPPDRVWRALTQPALMREWLMQTDFAPVVGRAFTFTSEVVTVECRVIEIETGRRLSYSWDAFTLESTVTWTLEPTASGTRLTMAQAGFRADQKQELGGARAGWARFLDRLETLLGTTTET